MIKRKKISKNSRSRRAAPGLVMAAVVGVGPAALAAPGDLDPTFGTGGKVTTDFVGTDDSAEGVVLQPEDGKIVAAGSASNVPGTGNDFALARYNEDGTLDPGFDGDGKVTTNFSVFGFGDRAEALVLQSDGKVVAAGVAANDGTGNDFGLARYNTDGSLDFKVASHFESGEFAEGVALLSDGRIVLAGSIPQLTDFGVALYTTGGALDTNNFGAPRGWVTTDFNENSDAARAVVVQSDNKIIAAGDGNANFELARYNDDGSLDTTFDTDGKVTTDFGGSEGAKAVIVQPDGKIIAAGSTQANGISDFALARYNTDGSLDDGGLSDITTGDQFGTGGKVITNVGGDVDFGNALVLQPDGKIIAVGDGSGDFGIVRYTTAGALDSTFGVGGKVTTDFANSSDGAHAAVLQSDLEGDKLIVAGTSGQNFALARYDLADAPDTTPPETTITVGPADGSTTNSAEAIFAFSSEEGATFQCKLDPPGPDGGSYATCTSPNTYSNLTQGEYTFSVKATDLAGNEDQSPASRTWTVDPVPPTVLSVNPSDAQIGVTPTTNITVTFSEKMDDTTLNQDTVKLVKLAKNPPSIPLTMTKTTDVSGRTVLTLDPYGSAKQKLGGNTTYRVTIEGAGDTDGFAVKDVAGNQLAQDRVSSFTTAKK